MNDTDAVDEQVVEVDIKQLFKLAKEDLRKGETCLHTQDSQRNTANRMIKLSKRLFDIYKIFESEVVPNLSPLTMKSMLHFARACLIVTHVLRWNDWVNLPQKNPVARQLRTLPKRAIHKVYKYAFKLDQYKFVHNDVEYKSSGIGQVIKKTFVPEDKPKKRGLTLQRFRRSKRKPSSTTQGMDDNSTFIEGRNFEDELSNVALATKDMGTSLLFAVRSSDLLLNYDVDESEDFNESQLNKLLNFEAALTDIGASLDMLVDYYSVIEEQVKLSESLKISDEEILERSQEGFMALLDKYGISFGKEREYSRSKPEIPTFIDINNTTGDVVTATKVISALEANPEHQAHNRSIFLSFQNLKRNTLPAFSQWGSFSYTWRSEEEEVVQEVLEMVLEKTVEENQNQKLLLLPLRIGFVFLVPYHL
eukprot:maker-scaffold_14-snap-gene-1.2-mRNA-1 protein AED:0.17 eAED:0.91 QI:0/0/0/1/0/0/3/0/420